MIQDVLSFATCFELNNDPKNVQVTDDTPYGAEGIALTDVEGFFVMKGPDSIDFHVGNIGSPDIDADVSLIFSGAILPLDTNGKVQRGTYTITYEITVSGAIQPGTYQVVKTYNFQYEAAIVRIDLIEDCRCSSLVSTDVTEYGTPTIIARTHTVHPPTGADPTFTDTVSSNAIITVTPITNKTWSSEISSVVTYDFADDLCVIDTITGAEENTIECDISLCDIFCCVKTVADKYFTHLDRNEWEAANIKRDQFDPVMSLVVLHDFAIRCGQDKLATIYYNKILEISECTPDCSCTDDKPTLIIPICAITGGAGGDTIVDVCGNGAISLAINIVGDTTTYTLCFDQDLLDKLNALFNTTLTQGDGISIVPTIDPNGNIDYLITNTNQESDKSLLTLEIDFGTGLPVFTILNENIIGSKFDPAALDFKNSSNFSDWSKQNNEFEVKDFLVAADPFNQVLDISSTIHVSSSLVNLYGVIVTTSITAGNGSIKFELVDNLGMPFSGSALNKKFDKVILTLNLNSL